MVANAAELESLPLTGQRSCPWCPRGNGCDRLREPGSCEEYRDALPSGKRATREARAAKLGWTWPLCPDAGRPDGPVRVAFWTPILENVGGAKTWYRSFIPHLDRSIVEPFVIAESDGTAPEELEFFRSRGVSTHRLWRHEARELIADRKIEAFVYYGIPRPDECIPPDWPGKVIAVSHGDHHSYWTIRLLQEASPHYHRVVAVSNEAMRPIPPDRIHDARVILAGIDLERVGKTIARWEPTDRTLLFVGRYTAEKAADRLIRALALLPREEGWNAAFIGEGADRGGLEALASNLGVDVRWHEPRQNPIPWILESGIRPAALVVPSDGEGFCYTAVEGVACCIPTLMQPTGWAASYPDLVRLLPSGATPADIAAAVLADRADADGTIHRVARGRQVALEVFNPHRSARRWEEFLVETVRPAAAPNAAAPARRPCGCGAK